MTKQLLFLSVLVFSLPIVARELLPINPNTSKCDLLGALNGFDNLPPDCPRSSSGGGLKGSGFVKDEPQKTAQLENQQFENNSAELSSIARSSLRNLADAMNETPNERYAIQGHASRVGSYELNMKLSIRRANNVRNFLVVSGVAKNCLIAQGFSYDKLNDEDHPEDASNRRVEFLNIKEINQ
ncbi:OmpA family protein [Methyloglobulus sp.]|uniref:OmpA family protein n=1 Tax=Methyloglobulus sp. TaxID=2518622 RepID=UPI0032B8235A